MATQSAGNSREAPKRSRADGQVTGLAGELFVAAELLKRGLQTSVTFGNAKAIDLLAYNERTKRTFSVQVKSLREDNYFVLGHGDVKPQHVYVFVVLNKPGEPVDYFVVPGRVLHEQPKRFAKYFMIEKMPGIHPKVLDAEGFRDGWHVFDEPAPIGVRA